MFHTCKQDSAEKFKNHRELKRKKFIESLSILSFKINKPVHFCAVLKCSVIHSDSLWPHELSRLFVQAILQARILEWAGHFLLQRIFLTQRLNPHLLHLLHWQAVSLLLHYLLLLLSHFSRVQLCATPIDSSPPSSSVPGILQARILEWVTISFSSALGSPKFLYQSYFFYAYSFFYDSMTCFSHQVIYAEYFPISLMSYRKSFSHHLGCYQVLMIMHSSVLNILNIYVCSA